VTSSAERLEQQYAGGSMRPMIESQCLTTPTEHRIADLKSIYEDCEEETGLTQWLTNVKGNHGRKKLVIMTIVFVTLAFICFFFPPALIRFRPLLNLFLLLLPMLSFYFFSPALRVCCRQEQR
jgi:hypothetical protein